MKAELTPIDHITVTDDVTRPLNKVTDDRERKSIDEGGIQQPLILVRDGERLLLAKGLRRLRIARALGMTKVPTIAYNPPAGQSAEEYVRELRLVLEMLRQDLLPSQKCGLVEDLKSRFSMNNEQVAVYLGIAPDSVTNWLAVRRYIEPVVKAMDSGDLTMRAARGFDGLSEYGQHAIWNEHFAELTGNTSTDVHKILRFAYPPEKFPKYYRNAKLAIKRLNRKQSRRRGVTRETITAAEKRRLLSSVDMKEAELRDGKEKLARYEREINASIAPIHAIMRNEKLLAHVPEEMREELARFCEVY